MRPIFSDEKEQDTNAVNSLDLERASILAMLKNL